MKKILITCATLVALSSTQAQNTLENRYRMPMREVFATMERRYDVKIVVPSDVKSFVDTAQVTYAMYRLEPNFEESFKSVLFSKDLGYVMNPDGSYKIKFFEYSRTTPEKGKERLEYLYNKYDNLQEWEARRNELKRCMYANLGIAPLTDRLVLKYTATPRRKMDGYTVENFYLETLPGVYATGSVYRPLKSKGKTPLILNPNGHFAKGRYEADMQKRCASFARMGAVAVNCDLFAWGESLLAFKSADHRLSTAQQMQILNQLAILNYFSAQPDIDTERVAITGASGGGSQTMMMTAIDDRIKASAPVVMTSCYFNGGCGCESGMPVHQCGDGTNNAEVAAIVAPRPMLIVSDGKDWTAHVPEMEYPFIRRTYGFYGKESNVSNVHLPTEGHDYGFSKRIAVYDFMSNVLNLNASAIKDKNGKYDESFVTVEAENDLKAFGANGENFPKDALRGIDNLLKIIAE